MAGCFMSKSLFRHVFLHVHEEACFSVALFWLMRMSRSMKTVRITQRCSGPLKCIGLLMLSVSSRTCGLERLRL